MKFSTNSPRFFIHHPLPILFIEYRMVVQSSQHPFHFNVGVRISNILQFQNWCKLNLRLESKSNHSDGSICIAISYSAFLIFSEWIELDYINKSDGSDIFGSVQSVWNRMDIYLQT